MRGLCMVKREVAYGRIHFNLSCVNSLIKTEFVQQIVKEGNLNHKTTWMISTVKLTISGLNHFR